MRFYGYYEQNDRAEVMSFLREQKVCHLVTHGPEGTEVGYFNPHLLPNGSVMLHLNRGDEQIKTLRAGGRATVVFQDVPTLIPSWWVDEANGSAATMYYRFAQLDGPVEVVEDPAVMMEHFRGMMAEYQPEQRHAPLDHANPLYAASLSLILMVILKPERFRTKWKLGQNRPVATRRNVVARLRERAQGFDLRCAEEVERWISRNPG